MKTVMLYSIAEGGLAKAKANYPQHRARLDAFHARGVLLMAGPYANPMDGAMAVFTNRAAAEEFVSQDPFVTEGVVGKYTLQEWNEVLA